MIHGLDPRKHLFAMVGIGDILHHWHIGAFITLQYLQRNGGASLSIRQGVVVVGQIIAAAGGDHVEVVTTLGPDSARGDAGAVERIVGIVHLIDAEDGFQTAFVKSLVVGHEGEARYHGFYLPPNVREDGGILRIGGAQAVHHAATEGIILRLGLDERVELIHYLTATHYDYAHRADRRPLVVGCFKIYCCKVLHIRCVY